MELLGVEAVSSCAGAVQEGGQQQERVFRVCAWCGGSTGRDGVRSAVGRGVCVALESRAAQYA